MLTRVAEVLQNIQDNLFQPSNGEGPNDAVCGLYANRLQGFSTYGF